MKFRFDIRLTEEDYINFNLFSLNINPETKKQMKTLRIVINILFVLIMLLHFIISDEIVKSIVFSVLILIGALVFNLIFNKITENSIKNMIKKMKKSGKLPFSPESVLEFYDDYGVEITPYARTEHKHSAIEKIYLSDHRYIYMYINSSQAYIIPLSAFSSEEHFNSFMNFISTKCSNITVC